MTTAVLASRKSKRFQLTRISSPTFHVSLGHTASLTQGRKNSWEERNTEHRTQPLLYLQFL